MRNDWGFYDFLFLWKLKEIIKSFLFHETSLTKRSSIILCPKKNFFFYIFPGKRGFTVFLLKGYCLDDQNMANVEVPHQLL